MAEAFFFWIFATILVGSALAVILARNPVHSVLFLILAFVSAAGLFLIMGAEFLAMILVVVYVGAVAVLFLFIVMLLDVDFARMKQGFVQYLPQGLLIAFVCRRRARLRRLGLGGLAQGRRRRHAVGHALQHRRARRGALHPLLLLLPGGGHDPAHRHDRRDRHHPASQSRASSARTSAPRSPARPRPRSSCARSPRAPASEGSFPWTSPPT